MASVDIDIKGLASKLGCTQSTIYRWLAADKTPRFNDHEVLWQLADITRTSARFLTIGKGGPTQRPKMSDEEIVLFDRFRSLKSKGRECVIHCCNEQYRQHLALQRR